MTDSARPLLLIRTVPDLAALARWATRSGQQALRVDRGYALHAAARATLGVLAPKPFALVERQERAEFIGYRRADMDEVHRAIELGALAEPDAALALGLADSQPMRVVAMPDQWKAGQRLAFDVRIAPVVRSRSTDGRYPEMDAAFHPAFSTGVLAARPSSGGGESANHDRHEGRDGHQVIDREAAHGRWLARELARDGAASLLTHRQRAFRLTSIARRIRPEPDSARQTREGLLPDLTVRGVLRIDDPPAFSRLIERGLGRHRSFGYGCLLLAPEGALT